MEVECGQILEVLESLVGVVTNSIDSGDPLKALWGARVQVDLGRFLEW